MGAAKIKFKEEILPPRQGVGYRSLYSHNCVLQSAADIGIHREFAQLKTDFPALGVLTADDAAPVVLVNGVTIDELETDTGELDFGHEYRAESSIAVWRPNAQQAPLIGEFSFQVKFRDAASVDASARDKALHFYQKIQSDLGDWVAIGATKTSLIYGGTGRQE